ncbi:hypothetical protein HUS23_03470 [Ectothiorhodospiraceae bacterium 2226]|nr:hypothetical protein HUS23_03470 [Ectothiorhodospiraceae bacterium 2226]
MRRMPPSYIANFDSATAMLRATARFLRGKDFPALGQTELIPLKRVVPLANRLPDSAREILYTVGGWGESVSPKKIHTVDTDAIYRWAANIYPQRKYPAVMIGSANGGLVHLASALGIPWLPQTFLVPVSQTDVHPDDVQHGLDAAMEPARILLENNPDIQLNHMHDPNQDRLMLNLMTYFRIKRLRLGPEYERFLEQNLPPGGTIFIVDCRRQWPVTRLGDRHVFQAGALGGATEEEFLKGSPRVEEYLARYDSHKRRWDAPEPTEHAPEAEWGFEPRMGKDIERFAKERGYEVVRIVFEEPEHFSPMVADLYRWWYAQRRIKANRLLVESFILMEPYWALRLGAVPYWMKFNKEGNLDSLNQFLDAREPFDYIHLTLFMHGVDSVGLPPLEDWRKVLRRARKEGHFLGVDEAAYPRDFGIFGRYHTAIQKLAPRYPVPGPLALSQLHEFLEQSGQEYPIEWRGFTSGLAGRQRAAS